MASAETRHITYVGHAIALTCHQGILSGSRLRNAGLLLRPYLLDALIVARGVPALCSVCDEGDLSEDAWQGQEEGGD